MKYWFKIVLYFFFVAFVTYFVIFYSEAAKIIDFLSEQQENVEDNTLSFLAAAVMANNHDGTDVYIKKDPLFEEIYNSPSTSQHVRISIYTLVEFNENKAHNSLLILLRNIELNNDDVYLDKNDYQEFKANFMFDKPITVNDYTASSFNETFVTAYDNSTKLILINSELFKTANGYAQIKRLDITYSLTSGVKINFVTLYNEDLISINPNDSFDGFYNRNISSVTYENINILDRYGLNNFKNNEAIYYDSSLVENLDYYGYYIKYILIELLFLIPITYLIFFHKRVMKLYRYNKKIKIEQYKLRQSMLKQKFKEQEYNKEKKA